MKIHRLILVCLAPLAAACTCTGQVGGADAVDASSPVDSGAGQPGLDAGPQLPRCGAVTTAPAPPSALLATSVTSYEVSLAWQPSPDPSTRRYRVLRGAAEIAIVTATTFTHRPAVPGETWVYRVTALSSDAESAPSNEVSVTIPAATPNAIDALLPGHWYEVPNSHLRGSAVALTSADYPWLGQGEGLSGIINDWSSGAFDTQRDRLYLSGGGHNGYFGNEVYGFDLRTLAWVRLTNPDPVTDECPARELGVNCATHTYDGLEYLPPPFDRFMAVGWDGWHQATLNLDTNRWEAHPDLPQKGARTGANCAYDVNTRVLWYHAGGGALSYWSPDTGRWTLRGDVDDVGYYRNGVIDPKRKRYLGVGQGHVESWSIDALGPVAPGYARLPTTGATEIEDPGNPGAEYDPIGDQLVAWKGQGDIYTLDLATNVWVKHAPVGTVTPGTANVNGTYGRFRYVPSLNVFVVVSSVDENVFVYRLDASEPKLLRRLEVTPAQPRLEANLRSTLTVNAVYRDGTSRDVTGSAVFRSLDPGIATVDFHGAVHAHNPGKARLQASYTDPDTRLGMVGAVELEVVGLSGELVLERLTIESSSAQIALVGEQRALRVLGQYHRDSNTFSRDVSCLVSWASGTPTTASVVGSMLRAGAVGTTTLTATLGSVTTSLALEVLASARPLVTTLNFQPPGAPSVIGWAVADDSGFDATRGWGWVSGNLWTRGDRNATPDPRLASFVGAMAGSFRLQVPDGRYHLAAAMGDNAFGSGLSRLDVGSQNLVAHVGNGNTSGGGIVEVTGGMGLLLTVDGPLNWLAVMPVNGLDFEAALLSAKTW